MMQLLNGWKIIGECMKKKFTYIHDGTPCNPFPLSTNQTSVQIVIQNSLLRDIFQDF